MEREGNPVDKYDTIFPLKEENDKFPLNSGNIDSSTNLCPSSLGSQLTDRVSSSSVLTEYKSSGAPSSLSDRSSVSRRLARNLYQLCIRMAKWRINLIEQQYFINTFSEFRSKIQKFDLQKSSFWNNNQFQNNFLMFSEVIDEQIRILPFEMVTDFINILNAEAERFMEISDVHNSVLKLIRDQISVREEDKLEPQKESLSRQNHAMKSSEQLPSNSEKNSPSRETEIEAHRSPYIVLETKPAFEREHVSVSSTKLVNPISDQISVGRSDQSTDAFSNPTSEIENQKSMIETDKPHLEENFLFCQTSEHCTKLEVQKPSVLGTSMKGSTQYSCLKIPVKRKMSDSSLIFHEQIEASLNEGESYQPSSPDKSRHIEDSGMLPTQSEILHGENEECKTKLTVLETESATDFLAESNQPIQIYSLPLNKLFKLSQALQTISLDGDVYSMQSAMVIPSYRNPTHSSPLFSSLPYQEMLCTDAKD